MGLIFKIFRKPWKILKIQCFVSKLLEIGILFQKNLLNMGTYFLEKLPLNMSIGLELPAAHPLPIQFRVPYPPGGNVHMLQWVWASTSVDCILIPSNYKITNFITESNVPIDANLKNDT